MKKTLFIIVLNIIIDTTYGQHNTVKIINEYNSWSLELNGRPFYVKGVVGDTYLEKVQGYGGNSIRMGSRKENLDKARQLGLSVLVNLPAGAERYGFSYDDTAAVRKQTEKIISIVNNTRDHPSVLMWAVGNELDFVPPNNPFNPKVWDGVNEAAKAIHAIDPDHPVMTVIGTSRMYKVADIVERCPDLDLLGINSYGDIYTIGDTLLKYGWTKPYVIAEWGPDGYWEVRKTSWKAPYEQTGREKYDCYESKYLRAMSTRNRSCLGSYVFYWSGFKQETTHTWFCMFDSTGLESPQVGLMHKMWTGMMPDNEAPIVDSLNIDQYVRYNDIIIAPGSNHTSVVRASDPDNDSLTYSWEIKPEAKYASYAGQGEVAPKPVAGLVSGEGPEVTFRAPSEPGAYRLFVYAFDINGHFSTANLPFLVK
ncbi:MAG TPA: glycoside hydrolase family 2 TIM barrel-domain containing protein [Bacteroidales bacterium]|nr:glycoside hydrolase family 2 TIM barrel-domain containing protein [Bacteroidales bacterium]